MKIVKETPELKFKIFLQNIGGLKSGYYPEDRPPIIGNICECGDGWLPLIQECIQKLIDAGWNKEIIQIKEKFGTLRFYTNKLNDECWKIISEAEEKSAVTCELCGQPGILRKDFPWIRTLCENDYNEFKKRYEK